MKKSIYVGILFSLAIMSVLAGDAYKIPNSGTSSSNDDVVMISGGDYKDATGSFHLLPVGSMDPGLDFVFEIPATGSQISFTVFNGWIMINDMIGVEYFHDGTDLTMLYFELVPELANQVILPRGVTTEYWSLSMDNVAPGVLESGFSPIFQAALLLNDLADYEAVHGFLIARALIPDPCDDGKLEVIEKFLALMVEQQLLMGDAVEDLHQANLSMVDACGSN